MHVFTPCLLVTESFRPKHIQPGFPASPDRVTSRAKPRQMPSFAVVVHNARVLLVIDLIGVFVFALAGATAAVRQRLDSLA
jgi:hypothetical protein